jgi:hypothetical protein
MVNSIGWVWHPELDVGALRLLERAGVFIAGNNAPTNMARHSISSAKCGKVPLRRFLAG